VGTFDEIWDTVSCKAIGMKGMVYKPICLINTDGFYDGFAMQMERAQKEGSEDFFSYSSLFSFFFHFFFPFLFLFLFSLLVCAYACVFVCVCVCTNLGVEYRARKAGIR
jgi:hypothetical protein